MSTEPAPPAAASPRPARGARARRAGGAWGVTRGAFAGLLEHQSMGAAAMIAYYLLFAIFPFLLSLASLLAFLPIPDLMDRLMFLLGQVAPPAAADLLRSTLRQLVTRQHGGLFSLGLLVALWAAANAVEAMMQSFNRILGLREHRPFWRTRGLAILLAIGVSVFTVLGLVALWFGSQVSHWWAGRGGLGPLPVQVWDVARWPLVLVFLVVAVDQLYFLAPAARQRWRWVSPGAVLAVLGWVAASLGFSAYVRHFGSYNATYGGIGAVIILLSWIYLSAFFILVGAEVNAAAGADG